MIIAVDIDGTLCTWHPQDYELAEPFTDKISIIAGLSEAGHCIWIYTGRGSSLGSAEAASEKWGKITEDQLKRWGVPYERLIFGKPMFDVLIDDRAINFDGDWADGIKSIESRINNGNMQ